MFWVHNEVIYKMGPLEYILNTPSHHRVHHGWYFEIKTFLEHFFSLQGGTQSTSTKTMAEF